MPVKTILFDLDGTFLEYDMVQDFLPRYFRTLVAWMTPHLPPERFIPALEAGTDAITRNDGQWSNAEVFAATFYPLTGMPRETLEPHFEAFYREAFPTLHSIARPRPEARLTVELAFTLGYEVIIATNPYFPAVATLERLRWANIADFAYRHITTYENSTAVKPDARYYSEILGIVGCQPAEALMVGDEAMDMAAGALGCLTYLIQSPATTEEALSLSPTFKGDLDQLREVLTQLSKS